MKKRRTQRRPLSKVRDQSGGPVSRSPGVLKCLELFDALGQDDLEAAAMHLARRVLAHDGVAVLQAADGDGVRVTLAVVRGRLSDDFANVTETFVRLRCSGDAN